MADIVVIGGSWGGSDAAAQVLAALPDDFQVPVVLALHRAPGRYTGGLSSFLGDRCSLGVHEASDKDELRGGCVYLAPADYHVVVEPGLLALSVDAPVRSSRPSIDVLFETAATSYGAGVIAIVLTGANADGADGARRVIEAGGTCLVQDPATAERAEMPAAAIAAVTSAGGAVTVAPLNEISDKLLALASAARIDG